MYGLLVESSPVVGFWSISTGVLPGTFLACWQRTGSVPFLLKRKIQTTFFSSAARTCCCCLLPNWAYIRKRSSKASCPPASIATCRSVAFVSEPALRRQRNFGQSYGVLDPSFPRSFPTFPRRVRLGVAPPSTRSIPLFLLRSHRRSNLSLGSLSPSFSRQGFGRARVHIPHRQRGAHGSFLRDACVSIHALFFASEALVRPPRPSQTFAALLRLRFFFFFPPCCDVLRSRTSCASAQFCAPKASQGAAEGPPKGPFAPDAAEDREGAEGAPLRGREGPGGWVETGFSNHQRGRWSQGGAAMPHPIGWKAVQRLPWTEPNRAWNYLSAK